VTDRIGPGLRVEGPPRDTACGGEATRSPREEQAELATRSTSVARVGSPDTRPGHLVEAEVASDHHACDPTYHE